MGGVIAFVGRNARLDVLGNPGFLRVDGSAQFGGVILVQQVLDRVLHEVRVAEVAVAVDVRVAHGFDLVVQALGRVIAEVGHRVAFEDVHDFADDHPARARWWCGHHVVATVVTLDGRQFAGLVFVQVGLGDDAFARLAGIHNRLGYPAFVKAIGALGGDFPQGFRQVFLHQLLAHQHRLASVQEDAAQVFVFLEFVSSGVQQVDIALLQGKTVFGQLDRRGDDLGALEGAVFAQRQFHARHSAGNADRQVALGAEVRDHVAVLVQVHVGGRGQRGFFAEVEEGLAAVGQLHGHEPTPAEVAGCRVHHGQGVAHRHRRIHGVAAGLEHIHAHMGRQMLGGDHHAIFASHRGLGGRLHAADSQHQRGGNQSSGKRLVFHPCILCLLEELESNTFPIQAPALCRVCDRACR